jgi:hypothetical protein
MRTVIPHWALTLMGDIPGQQWPAWVQDKLRARVQLVVSIACLVFVELFLIYAYRVMYLRFWA